MASLRAWAQSASTQDKIKLLDRIVKSLPEYRTWPQKCAGVPVGLVGNHPAYLRFEGHSLVLGQSGEGKFSAVIAPMLLHDVRDERGVAAGMVVVDPKNGEAARVTSGYRRLLREEQVFVIDPYGLAGGQDGLNPFDFLDPASDDFFENCRGLADALVVPQPKERRTESFHWESIGAMWLTAMIAHLVLTPEEERTIRRLRSIFSETGPGLLLVLTAMETNPLAPSWVRDTARSMQRVTTEAQKEASGYLATIYEATKFADSAAMTRVLDRSTFDPITVRAHGATVFIVADDQYLPQCAPWIRLVCETMRQRITRSPVRRQVHWVLDEAMAFGAWAFIEQGLRAMRGADMSLHLFYQNVGQIKRVWSEGWTSITDARLIRFLGSNDVETLEWIAKLCGEKTVVDYGRSSGATHTNTHSTARNANWSNGATEGTSEGATVSRTRGTSHTLSRGESLALARSFGTQRGTSTSSTSGTTTGWSTGWASTESFGSSTQTGSSSSDSRSWSHTLGSAQAGTSFSMSGGGGSQSGDSSSSGTSYGQSFSKNGGNSGGSSSSTSFQSNSGSNSGRSRTRGRNIGFADGRNESEAKGQSTNRTSSTTRNQGHGVTETRGASTATTSGQSATQRRRLMTVDEVRRMPPGKLLVFVNREPDCVIDRLHYFECPPLTLRALQGRARFPLPEDD